MQEARAQCRRPRLRPWWEGPLEEERAPTPVFLPGESHGQRSLRPAVHRVAKSQTCFDHESDIDLYIFYIFIIHASSRACYRTW